MTDQPLKIAFITAGGAGMFCGSCMQDNALALSLRELGHDAVLIPTYTPLTLDEVDATSARVFLGGVNLYLDSRIPGWNRLPRWLNRWLDRPSVLKLLTRNSSSTDAASLGPLTIDMLSGREGPQSREYQELADYVVNELQPDVILLTNALLSAVGPMIRSEFPGKIVCLLQGDDVFLDALPQRWRKEAIRMMRLNLKCFDGFLVHSNYYGRHMAGLLELDEQKLRRIPLQVATDRQTTHPIGRELNPEAPFCIGYFARICPEKGADLFLQAFADVFQSEPDVRGIIAGYLPDRHRKWFLQTLERTKHRVGDSIEWRGSPKTRSDKLDLMAEFDLLCVPSPYREPKGLYLLEAGSLGIPGVAPDHGAFPELIAGLGEGRLFRPDNAEDLSSQLREAARDYKYPDRRNAAALKLIEQVRTRHAPESAAEEVVRQLSSL